MKIRLDKEQRRLFEVLFFLAKLLVFAIPLYIIITFHNVLLPLQEAVVQNIQFILNSMGFEVLREGFLLTADGVTFIISEDCTGWKSMLFLVALMLAVPRVETRKHIIGMVIGVPVIYAGNLLRILIMVFISKAYGPGFAGVIHDYFWQAGLISLVLIVWLIWLILVKKLEITF